MGPTAVRIECDLSRPRLAGWHEHRTSLAEAWGHAAKGVATFVAVIAGSSMTVYSLAEGSLPE